MAGDESALVQRPNSRQHRDEPKGTHRRHGFVENLVVDSDESLEDEDS